MRKLGVLFVGCLSLMIPIASAKANATQSLFIESFEYKYEPTGLPVVRLLLKNEGDGSLEPEIAITLKKAYSGRQFSVTEKDVRSAKLALKENHLEQFNDNDPWPWRYWTAGTGLVLILLVSAWTVRRNSGKKQ